MCDFVHHDSSWCGSSSWIISLFIPSSHIVPQFSFSFLFRRCWHVGSRVPSRFPRVAFMYVLFILGVLYLYWFSFLIQFWFDRVVYFNNWCHVLHAGSQQCTPKCVKGSWCIFSWHEGEASWELLSLWSFVYICMHACLHVCVCVCVYVYVYVYVCVYVCMCMCIQFVSSLRHAHTLERERKKEKKRKKRE